MPAQATEKLRLPRIARVSSTARTSRKKRRVTAREIRDKANTTETEPTEAQPSAIDPSEAEQPDIISTKPKAKAVQKKEEQKDEPAPDIREEVDRKGQVRLRHKKGHFAQKRPEPIRMAENLAASVKPAERINFATLDASKEMMITPVIAAQLFKQRATQQRPVKINHVNYLARQMTNETFRWNGDTIRVNREGRLLDGQHRCLASVSSGRAFKAIVVPVEDDAFMTIDTGGRARLNGDVFRMEGEENYTQLASALSHLANSLDEYPLYVSTFTRRRSPMELKDLLEQHPDMRASVALANRLPRQLGALSMFAAIHYLFARVSSDDANNFFELLIKGSGLPDGSPIWTLREKLSQNQMQTIKASRRDLYTWFVKSWNAFRNNEQLWRLTSASRSSTDPEIL